MATLTATTTDMSPTGTYLDEPPAYDFGKLNATDRKELIAETRSVSSSITEGKGSDTHSVNTTTTDAATIISDLTTFAPTRSLLINALGIRFIRLPLPPRQLDIPITDKEGNLVYISRRAKKCSGNAVLSDANGTELLASAYQWGPGRDPKIHLFGQAPVVNTTLATAEKATTEEQITIDGNTVAEIKTKGRWTSTRQEFILPSNRGSFTWRYVKERDAFLSVNGKEKKRRHLVLEVTSTNAASSISLPDKNTKVLVKRVAELVRNAETRTPGTSSMDAGNGGELQIDAEFCESIGLREEWIVASCLMMLKKEIDRQRGIQFAIIAGASA